MAASRLGVVTLVDASRTGKLVATRQQVPKSNEVGPLGNQLRQKSLNRIGDNSV